MKKTIKQRFFLSLCLLMLFSLFGGGKLSAAEQKTWTWTASAVEELGTTTPANVTLNEKAWTVTRSKVEYNGTGLNSGCIQLGKKNAPEEVTLSSDAFKGVIKSVLVECSSYKGAHKCDITVGGVPVLSNTKTPSWTTVDAITKSGIEKSGKIQIRFYSGTGALYIKKIIVTYDDSGASSSAFTVKFNAGENGTCETPSLTETAAGAGVKLPACVANERYKFVGWSTSETPTSADAGQAGETYYPSEDCTLYAYYKQLSTITKVVNGKSTTEQVENGTEIPFTAPDAASIPTGYVFVGWTDTQVDGTQTDAPTLVSSPVTASTDATYYAVFAVSKSTGKDVWEEITTVPEPGTYAILSDSYFMKAEITSGNRFANGAKPEISATSPATLTTAPASECIWEITKPDAYYRIAYGSQYAGGTSEKNKGALLDNASDDLAKWTIEYKNNQFSVINYGRSEASKDSGNKYLRNNTDDPTYGWACYASGTGKAPRLFKKTIETVLSDYCTTIPVQLTVGETGYATLYYSNYDLVVPENTEAYTFRSSNGALMKSKTYAADEVIPAGEAVVVYTANDVPCTLNFKKGIATLACDASSQLAGTDEKTVITPDTDYYFYGLSLNNENDINSVGFYWMNDTGAAFTNGAHKAYLKILKSEFADTQSVRGFAFKGTTTGVESVESSNNAPQAIYDLTGRRVSKAEKGIYIINGKKVIK